jgi:ATPase subunit of ABC transporter with duplicated ATPase domains
VLLGVMPTIALAVVVDALFALWGALLKGEAVIEFNGVSKTFAGLPAVKNLNLHLREGAFSVLIGTSGSGNRPR